MRDRYKLKMASETLSLFAIVFVVMMFGAGIFYEGASFNGTEKTARLAAADWYP
jgi:hypothetical protein